MKAEIRIVKSETLKRRDDETRSIEINMMRELMRRYPDKARELFDKMLLTKRAA